MRSRYKNLAVILRIKWVFLKKEVRNKNKITSRLLAIMDNFTNNLLLKDLTVVLSNNNLVKKYTLEPENVASNYNKTIPSSFDISSIKVKDIECPNISVSSININKKLAAYSKYSTSKCQQFELVKKTRTCTVSIKTFVSMTLL